MLGSVVRWWVQQLLRLLPARLRGDGASSARAVVVAWRTEPVPSFGVTAPRRGGVESLGTFSIDAPGLLALQASVAGRRLPVRLQVPAGYVLERRVSLPLAAEQEAARVLTYEMDRLTPFTPAEVYWGWTVLRRDRAAARVEFRLDLVPRLRLQPMLDALSRAGLRPVMLDGPAPDGTARRLPLAPEPSTWWDRHGLAMAAALCAVLTVLAVAIPFQQQSAAIQATDARIAALRPSVDRTEQLRRSILARSATTDALQAGRARSGDALAALAAITTVLPDDTYLTDLTLRSRTLVISGQSSAAARLIGMLSGEPGFRDPSFTAPLTRGSDGRGDAFSLRAEVTP